MTTEIVRTGWTQLFTQMRNPTGFLSRFFTIKPGGIYSGDKIAIDIKRFGEDVAVVVKKCTGPRLNDFDEFTTKEFVPPTYGEAFPVDVCELLNRMAGVDPYSAEGRSYSEQLIAKMVEGFMLVDDKISRAVELQASQILQTGQLSLTDENANVVYTLDFAPKVTHFPTVSTSWSDTANSTPLNDLEDLSEVIRSDGKVDSNILVFGKSALRNFLRNDDVTRVLDNRRISIGDVRPRMANSGATFYGFVWAGTYEYEMWAYPGEYKDPATGNPTKYVADDKVIMLSDLTRLDKTSARVPLPLGPDPRVASLMPGRMSSREGNFDVTPNLYATPNGKQIMGELESKPLLLPVQIDGFGCLDTEI